MKEKITSKFLQKGFIQLPIIAVAVLIVAAVTLPVVSSFIAQNKKITTQQRAQSTTPVPPAPTPIDYNLTFKIADIACPAGTVRQNITNVDVATRIVHSDGTENEQVRNYFVGSDNSFNLQSLNFIGTDHRVAFFVNQKNFLPDRRMSFYQAGNSTGINNFEQLGDPNGGVGFIIHGSFEIPPGNYNVGIAPYCVTPTPSPTPVPRVWNITAHPVCPSGMTPKPMRMFRIFYGAGDFNCVNSELRTTDQTMSITSRYPADNVYVGLEVPGRGTVASAACSQGTAFRPIAIDPLVTDRVFFNQYMNPLNWMAHWLVTDLPSNNYTIRFEVPAQYCDVSLSTPTPTRVLSPTTTPTNRLTSTPTPTSASCLSVSSCSELYRRGQAALNKSCGDAAYDKVVDFDKNRIVNNADAHEFALHCRDLNWCANRLADTTDPCIQTTPTPTIPAACQVATTISLKFCYGQCTSCENACGSHACIRVFHPAGAPADPDCENYGSTTIEYWAFKCTDTLPKSICSCANLPTGNPTGNPTANPTPPNTTITPQATITPGGSCAVPTPIVEPGGWCYGVCANCETNCLGGTKACRFYQDCWGGAGGYRCTTNLSRQTCSGCGGANPTPPNTTVTPQATVTPGGLTPTPTRGAGCNSCPAGSPARNRGNADCNSTIDADDLSLWYNQFLDNKTPSQTNSADFFCDGVVDESDLAIWYSNANIWSQ